MIKGLKYLAGFFLFALYLAHVPPGVFWGDSGLLIASSYMMGIPHPPGHPLFTLLGKIATLMPVGNIAFKLNMLSVLLCFVSFYLIFLVISDLFLLLGLKRDGTGKFDAWILAFVTSLSLALSGVTLAQSKAETYSLELLLGLFVVSTIVRSERHFDSGKIDELPVLMCMGSFACGLSFTNHVLISMSFVIPFSIYSIVRMHSAGRLKALLNSAVFFIVGLTVYIYLPLRAARTPIVGGGDPDTLYRFYWVASGGRYSEKLFSVSRFFENLNFANFLWITKATVKAFIVYLGGFWIGFFIIGMALLYKRRRPLFALLAFGIVFSVGVTFWWSLSTGMSITAGGDVGYYLVPVALCYAIGGAGLYFLIGFLSTARVRLASRFVAIVVTLVLTFFSLSNFYRLGSACSYESNYSARFFGRSVLAPMNYAAVYFANTDAGIFVPLYMVTCEAYRADIDIIMAGRFFNEYGMNILRARHPEILKDIPENFVFKDKKNLGKHLMSIGERRPVYLETSKADIFGVSLYPNVLSFGLGEFNHEVEKQHLGRTRQFYTILNAEVCPRTADCWEKRVTTPSYAVGYYMLNTGHYESALDHFNVLYKSEPQDVFLASSILTSHLRLKNYRAGARLGSEFVKKFKSPFIYYNYGFSLIYSGDKEKGLSVIRKGKELFPKSEIFN